MPINDRAQPLDLIGFLVLKYLIMKLISMTDFVLEANRFKESDEIALFKITNYAQFLKQPLKLSMFIPCDEDENPLKEPKPIDYALKLFNESGLCKYYEEDLKTFNISKEKVLFEGFYTKSILDITESFQVINNEGQQICFYKSIPNYFIWNYKTIEGLSNLELTLTESAIKQIGL